MHAYERLKENEAKKLSESAQDLSHLMHSFRKNEQLTNFVNVWMLEDPIQIPKTVTCEPFQIYFYKNLFFLDKNNKIQSYKKLPNNTTKTLLNKLFMFD